MANPTVVRMSRKCLASRLNRVIAVERAGIITNTHGDKVAGYADPVRIAAEVRAAPGRERLESAQSAAEALTAFTIRWSRQHADLSAKDRLEYPVGSGHYWNIVSVIEGGNREVLQIAAVRKAD